MLQVKRIKLKLEDLIVESGLTQSEVSDKTGVRAASISAYRKNRVERVDLDILARLCEYFDIDDMNDLFEVVDDDTAK